MSLVFTELQGSERSFMELDVSVSGMTLTVQAGTFKVARQTYELKESQEATFDVVGYPRSLVAYLVEEKATQEVSLLVDLARKGEGYLWAGSDPFVNLYCLLLAEIPANTKDLESVAIEVFRRRKEETPRG